MCSSKILVTSSAGNFQTAIFKFEALLSIFCGTKITLEWITSPIFRSTSHHALPIHYYWNFFNPPPPPPPPSLFNILKNPYPPFVYGWGGGRFKLWCNNEKFRGNHSWQKIFAFWVILGHFLNFFPHSSWKNLNFQKSTLKRNKIRLAGYLQARNIYNPMTHGATSISIVFQLCSPYAFKTTLG